MPDEDRDIAKIARLAAGAVDLVGFWRAATEVITPRVPYYWTPCWFSLDPDSLLITSHFHDGLDVFPAEWLDEEYRIEDVHQLADMAQSGVAVSTLHDVTGGDPSRTPRWKANMQLGGDQELIAPLRTRRGEIWGALGLYREPDMPLFDGTEKRFLAAAVPHLAAGSRRALLMGEASEPEYDDSPALLVIDTRGAVESATPGAERWLEVMPDGEAGRLPSVVRAVAARAHEEASQARVRTRTGQWVVLHGALMTPGPERVAVIIEPANPARIHPLLMSAFELTERERDVTCLVLDGRSTHQIAARLVVSEHTVQQHLKSIFDKTGVRSRRDLVAQVFFTHYEPRFRDNESRVGVGRPIRGGPAAPT